MTSFEHLRASQERNLLRGFERLPGLIFVELTFAARSVDLEAGLVAGRPTASLVLPDSTTQKR